MSGILGKLSFDRDETLARPILEQMLGVLQHGRRAATAIHVAPGIALGWCGTPDGPSSRQGVVTNEFQTVRVVAHSALTNAGELRERLERRGCRFRTATDDEVMAHAYDAWGDRCVEAFRGPFACAIWDGRHDRLLLARDHVGIQPLYFALLHGRGVVFASEIRALLQDPGVGRECSPEAIDAYLALGYVPAPLTAYQRVSKLEPAHRLTVEGRRLHVEQFWDLPTVSAGDQSNLPDALADGLAAAVTADGTSADAVLYSGGLASSALLAATPGSRVCAVTAVFNGEMHTAARVRDAARHAGHEPVLEAMPLEAPLDLAIELAAHLDEPIADPAALAQHAICAAAGRYAASVLSGHGAAALWAGYARHRVDRVEAVVRGWLGSRLGPLDHLATPLRDSLSGAPVVRSATEGAPATGLWDDGRRHALYTRGFASQVRHANPFARHVELYAGRESADPVDRALYVDVRTFLPDSALAMVQRTASAAGLTFRFPYLDRTLVELAARVPSSAKQPGGGMRPLRDLLARRLPPALLPPPRRAAAHDWLHGTLTALVPAVLLADPFDGRGIVSRTVLRQVWDEYCGGRRDHTRRLWSLLMLELWFRHFIDGTAAEEPTAEYVPLRAA